MTATQPPLSLARRHTNQQLFPDHYLNLTLPAVLGHTFEVQALLRTPKGTPPATKNRASSVV